MSFRRQSAVGRTGPAPGRAGFTLIEVVAALAISAILLAAVYGAFLLYSRIATTAQRPIDQAQIARAVLRQMSNDLRSLVYRPPEQTATDEAAADETAAGGNSASSTSSTSGTGTDGTGTGTGGTGTGTGTTSQNGTGTSPGAGTSGTSGTSTTIAGKETGTTGTAPSMGATSPNLGLVGDATTLVLHVSRPERGLNYFVATGASSVASRTSDLLSVSYFLASRGGGGMAGLVGERVLSETMEKESDGHPIGLARLEGDRLAIEHADIQSDEQTLADAARVIAREVVLLQFRYFDGAGWMTSWDTASQGRLPNAVEVTIGFRPPRRRRQPGERTAIGIVEPVTETITHVIDLPLAGSYAAMQAP